MLLDGNVRAGHSALLVFTEEVRIARSEFGEEWDDRSSSGDDGVWDCSNRRRRRRWRDDKGPLLITNATERKWVCVVWNGICKCDMNFWGVESGIDGQKLPGFLTTTHFGEFWGVVTFKDAKQAVFSKLQRSPKPMKRDTQVKPKTLWDNHAMW